MQNKILRKAIANKRKVEVQAEAGIKTYPCEEILGDMMAVRAFAQFFQKHKQDLDVIHASMLLDFCKRSYTKEQKDAFQLGLDAFLYFFQNAEADTLNYVQEST